jgi:hypothetical protein
MTRRLLLASLGVSLLGLAAASCGNRPDKNIEGFYTGMRSMTLMYPTGNSGEVMMISLEAQIRGRTMTVIMNDCMFEANWEIGSDTFTTSDFLCTIEVQGASTDMFGSGTVTAAGDGNLALDVTGMANDGATGDAGNFTLAFDGVLVMDNQ